MAIRKVRCCAAIVIGVMFAAARGEGGQAAHVPSAVRGSGPVITELLMKGGERSTTFRTLLGKLAASDWIVFVQVGSCRVAGVPACLLHRVGMWDGKHYLRIVVNDAAGTEDEVIATIGHELQHAAEVVGNSWISDEADIARLYQSIGYVPLHGRAGRAYETREAVRVGETVLRELRAGRQTCHEGAAASPK